MQFGGKTGQRVQQVVIPLLRHGPPDRQDNDGRSRVRAVPSRTVGRRSRETAQVQTVINERYLVGPRQGLKVSRPMRRQVTPQSASAIFSRFSQSGVVQMSFAWAEKLKLRPLSNAAYRTTEHGVCR